MENQEKVVGVCAETIAAYLEEFALRMTKVIAQPIVTS